MRAVVQRVTKSKVTVGQEIAGSIKKGLVVLLGIGKEDTANDIEYLTNKIVNLRVFEDENGKMNLSVLDINGELLVVSQFTLFGDCRKGNRPSFISAAELDEANRMYMEFVNHIRQNYPINVEEGKISVFNGIMQYSRYNRCYVHFHIRKNNGNLKRMRYKRGSGISFLTFVGFHRKTVRLFNQFRIQILTNIIKFL
jgi:D-tyrosyl-tRNA(Tyr) deacylase